MKTLLIILASTIPGNAAVLLNGSFEEVSGPPPRGSVAGSQLYSGGTDRITGWITTGGGVERFDPAPFGIGDAADGSFAIDLAYFTDTTGGGIQQNIATVPGKQFTLSFAASTATGGGRLGTAEIVLMIDGADIETFSLSNSSTALDWQTFSREITAAGSMTTIEFQNRQNANFHFANLDHVQIIPEPSSVLLALLGMTSLLRRRR